MVRSVLSSWPQLPSDSSVLRDPERRLVDAVYALKEAPGSVGIRDIIGLATHVLRHEALSMGGSPRLTLPSGTPWPSADDWRAAGLQVADHGREVTVEARSWRPPWPTEGPTDIIDLALAAPDNIAPGAQRLVRTTVRRITPHAIGDPYLRDVIGTDSYRGHGQREALRAVLTSRPGSTTLISLPTGTGKSAVALVPALLGDPDDLTIAVVPTTALALDQERAVLSDYKPMEGRLDGPFAYHSGLSQEERAAFRQRILDGHQRLVFTSPESAIGSLEGPIYTAAESGRLRYLVIDEAHIVSEWGDEFRPGFQQLAGLRWDLLRIADVKGHEPFRTLLLSATVTPTTLETLDALFGADSMDMVSSMILRPEMTYLVSRCDSPEQRMKHLQNALDHLPRPALIYVTKPENASRIASELQAAGLLRVAVVTGDTRPGHRLDVIRQWRGEPGRTRVDVVVASSAFGLGVDMSNVRTVIHACIPETVDRFYQEVGRAGRDGHAAVSLIMPCDSDVGVARALSSPTLIGHERGYERLRRMMYGAGSQGDGRFTVNLHSLPSDLTVSSTQNWRWNLRTLALAARAGLIRLETERPPARTQDETEEEWNARAEAAYEAHRETVTVRLLHADALDESVFMEAAERVRDRTYSYFQRSFGQVMSITRGSCPFEAFRDAYRIERVTLGSGQTVSIEPLGSCPGCATHVRLPADSSGAVEMVPPPIAVAGPISPALNRLFDRTSTLIATYPAAMAIEEWLRTTTRLVEALSRHGIVELIGPSRLLRDERLITLHRRLPRRFLLVSEEPHPVMGYARPTLHVVGPDSEQTPLPRRMLDRPDDAPPLVVLVSEEATDPERPTAHVSTTRTPHWYIDDLMGAL